MCSVLPVGSGPSAEGPEHVRRVCGGAIRVASLPNLFQDVPEKVWGVPPAEIQADWVAQRIKNLDLLRAVINSLAPRRKQTDITSLIEEFEYPRHGPGMMWERCHALVEEQGGEVHFDQPVTRIEHAEGRAVAVHTDTQDGTQRHGCDAVISSMPLPHLVRSMDPPPPAEVLDAADGLRAPRLRRLRSWSPRTLAFPTTGSTSMRLMSKSAVCRTSEVGHPRWCLTPT